MKKFSHIILEGVDGIGKNTLMNLLWPHFHGEKHVYCRGDISNWVYAQKYGRKFIPIQKDLDFLYIILIGPTERIKKQIKSRPYDNDENELNKISDQKIFIDAYNELKDIYNIILIDIRWLESTQIINLILNYINKKENE